MSNFYKTRISLWQSKMFVFCTKNVDLFVNKFKYSTPQFLIVKWTYWISMVSFSGLNFLTVSLLLLFEFSILRVFGSVPDKFGKRVVIQGVQILLIVWINVFWSDNSDVHIQIWKQFTTGEISNEAQAKNKNKLKLLGDSSANGTLYASFVQVIFERLTFTACAFLHFCVSLLW